MRFSAAMEVHRELGCGFLEAVYEEALKLEFEERDISFQSRTELPITYKSRKLKIQYRADFIYYDSVIVELKALNKLGDIEEAQILNYLKATGFPIGLLLNFGASSLVYRRFILILRNL